MVNLYLFIYLFMYYLSAYLFTVYWTSLSMFQTADRRMINEKWPQSGVENNGRGLILSKSILSPNIFWKEWSR
jgi:hypothetical protein